MRSKLAWILDLYSGSLLLVHRQWLALYFQLFGELLSLGLSLFNLI